MPHLDLDLPSLRAIAEAAAQRPTRYLATFDPPTALRIVNTLEEAYREINRYRCEAREAFAAQTLALDLRLAAAEARAEAAEAKLAAAVEEARREERAKAEATLSDVMRVVAPFLAIRDQALGDMIRLISKASDGFAPISVTVTKAQFLEAHKLAQAIRARAAQGVA